MVSVYVVGFLALIALGFLVFALTDKTSKFPYQPIAQ
jgi:hypothetical protein